MSIDIKLECRCGGSIQITGLTCPMVTRKFTSSFNEEHKDCLEKKPLVIKDSYYKPDRWLYDDPRFGKWVPKEQVDKDKENE